MSAAPFLDLCKNGASSSALTRGIAYEREGRVQTANLTSAGGIQAVVRGTGPYRVLLEYDGDDLYVECTCPAALRESVCKHAVALACHADAAGISRAIIEARRRGEILSRLPDPRSTGAGGGLLHGRAPSWRARLAQLQDGASRRREQATRVRGGADTLFELWIDPTECRTHNGLTLALTRKRKRKVGGYGESAPAKWASLEKYTSMSRDVHLALRRAASLGDDSAIGWRWRDPARTNVPSGDASRVFEAVHGIVPVYCLREDDRWTGPLTWNAEPWHFALTLHSSVDAATGEAVATLAGDLVRGAERRPLSEAHLLLSGGVVILGEEAGPFEDAGAFDWVANLRADGAITVRGDDIPAFLASLLDVALGVPIDFGDLAEQSEAPVASIDLSFTAGGPIEVAVTFSYDDIDVPAASATRHLIRGRGTGSLPTRILTRNDEAEAALLERLTNEGCVRSAPAWVERPYRMPRDDVAGRCARLIESGWQVRVERKALKAAGSLSMRVRSGIDWFDVEGEASFDEEALALPAILRAVEEGRGFVTLAGGGAALLPPEWTARLQALSAMAGPAEGTSGVRVSRARAPLLDTLLADLADVEADEGFERVREALRSFDGVRPKREPASFQGTLRSYQREGLGWFAFLRKTGLGGCLADDMGLGKTVQVLACLAPRRRAKDRRGPTLVVAPRSVMSNWIREARRFAPTLRCATYHGASRGDILVAVRADPRCIDLIVTTYGTMRRDIDDLATLPLDYAILDESQAIKNAASKTARAALRLDAGHRLALSGTPIENHLDELGSLFAFLNPGLLGTRREFQDLLGTTGTPSSDRLAWLTAALRPVILRRTREQVLTELPEKAEQILRCPLQPEQRLAYDGIREHYRASVLSRVESSGLAKSKMHVLEALLRLRQAACHPGLIDRARVGETAAKLDQLLPMLEEIADAGHKALVFSQFTSFLAIVRSRLDDLGIRYAYLDGQTTKRGATVDRFQEDPDTSAFLISLKAGGTGLNLTAAQYVFILDPWWNPAVEAQAVGRAHRMGQKNPVTVYRLIGENTVEDHVLQLQDRKRALVQAVLGGVNDAPLRGITRADLELLLG